MKIGLDFDVTPIYRSDISRIIKNVPKRIPPVLF